MAITDSVRRLFGSETVRPFVLTWDDIHNLYHRDLVDRTTAGALQDAKYIFEGRYCCSFSAENLQRLLAKFDLVVVQRYGSGTPGMEYLELDTKPLLPAEVEKIIPESDDQAMLEYAFEVNRFDGNKRQTFAYIASRILGPVLKKKIVLSVPHYRVHGFSTRGAFQVFVWSTPDEDHEETRTPTHMWGAQVSCVDRAFKPKDNGQASVLIKDGDYVVAELFENALYIHHDLVHRGDSNEFAIFAKIMQEVVKHQLTVEEWEERERETAGRFLERQRELFLEVVQGSIPARSIRHERALETANEKRDAAFQAYQAAERELFGMQHSRLDPSTVAERFTKEFALLQSGAVAMVESVYLEGRSGNPSLCVRTKEIVATNKRTGKRHLLGHFELRFNLKDATVTFNNLDRRFRGYQGEMQPAPHIFGNGKPCLGSIRGELSEYICHYEVNAAISLAIAFLQRGVDDGDPAGRVIEQFPLYRASEALAA